MGCCKAGEVNFREWLVYVRIYIPMTKTIAKAWLNSYLTTGNPKTLKNSKSTLNVLQVFQCQIEKLAKVKKRIIQKKMEFTEYLLTNKKSLILNR